MEVGEEVRILTSQCVCVFIIVHTSAVSAPVNS